MTEQPKRETWRDWQDERAPEPPLLTRAEVLALLARWKIAPKVEERTLRYWEQEGLIPRPTREHRGGVTRAWYPSWVPDLINWLRVSQRAGIKVGALRAELRAEAQRLSRDPRPHPFAPRPPRKNGESDFAAFVAEHYPDFLDGPRHPPPRIYDPPTLPELGEYYVLRGVEQALRDQYRYRRFATTRIEVRLLDAEGNARTYVVPLPADFELDPFAELLSSLAPEGAPGVGEEGA